MTPELSSGIITLMNEQTLQASFDNTKAILVDWINRYAYCVYGKFPEIDAIIDEFEEKIRMLEFKAENNDNNP